MQQLLSRQSVVGSVPVLSLSGPVDLATVPALRDALVRLVGNHVGQLVAVDLDGVDVLDDSGLGALLGAAGQARSGGGDTVTATVRYTSVTDVAMIGRLVGDVALRASVTMAVEPP